MVNSITQNIHKGGGYCHHPAPPSVGEMFPKVDAGLGFLLYPTGAVLVLLDVGVVLGERHTAGIVFTVFRVDQRGVLVWRNTVSWISASTGAAV